MNPSRRIKANNRKKKYRLANLCWTSLTNKNFRKSGIMNLIFNYYKFTLSNSSNKAHRINIWLLLLSSFIIDYYMMIQSLKIVNILLNFAFLSPTCWHLLLAHRWHPLLTSCSRDPRCKSCLRRISGRPEMINCRFNVLRRNYYNIPCSSSWRLRLCHWCTWSSSSNWSCCCHLRISHRSAAKYYFTSLRK